MEQRRWKKGRASNYLGSGPPASCAADEKAEEEVIALPGLKLADHRIPEMLEMCERFQNGLFD